MHLKTVKRTGLSEYKSSGKGAIFATQGCAVAGLAEGVNTSGMLRHHAATAQNAISAQSGWRQLNIRQRLQTSSYARITCAVVLTICTAGL